MSPIGRACRLHRDVLEGLVERGERGPGIAAALDHMEACATCERDLTELALTIAALRRAGRELRAEPVPVPAPARVAALAAPRPNRWSWRIQLGGLLTGAAIAALVAVPRTGTPVATSTDSLPQARTTVIASWRAAEAHLALTPDTQPFSARETTFPPRYPDGLMRPWKEVPQTDAVSRDRQAT